jgi:hypothetical protein
MAVFVAKASWDGGNETADIADGRGFIVSSSALIREIRGYRV